MKRNTLSDNRDVPSQNMRSLLSMEHFAIDTLISEEKPSHLYEWRFLFQKSRRRRRFHPIFTVLATLGIENSYNYFFV